ncbi:MAG: hypothetical protein IJJ99_04035 [Oscillospiraceae bacterium]|nr:hypothetical protein [Oscillospiraceae bacterium]
MNERDPEQLNMPDASEDYALEDIVREFGGDAPKEPVSGDTIPFSAVKEPSSDTISFPPVRSKPSTESDTIVFSPVAAEKEDASDTIAFTPVHAEQPSEKGATIRFVPPVRAEDASLEESQDADTAALPAPIPIPTQKERQKTAELTPQSVLKETAAGRIFLLVRTVLLGLSAIASVFLTLYAVRDWVFPGLSKETSCVLLMILLSVSVLLSYDVLWRGVRDLIRFHPSPFTLSIPLIVLAGIDAFRAAPARCGNYCGAVTLLLLFLMCALCAERSGRLHTLRTVCGFQNPMGIFNTPQVNKGAPSLRRDPANVGSFLIDLLQKDKPQMLLSIYCTVLFPLSAALAFLLTRRSGDFFFAWLLLLLGGLPFFSALSYPRIFALLARRLSRIGGALSGWHSAKIFGGKHTIIIRDEDLFPIGGITTNGMKIFGAHRPNRIISYALAALDAAGSPLTELFETLLKAQYGTHSVVSQHRFYDNSGIGAEIAGDVVLVGSLAFMHSMGVQMPAGAKVRLAVYVSVNGELAGIFAFKYKANTSSRKGLHDVLANRNFSVVLATRDFLITPELIAAKYRLPTDHMKFPAYPERLRLAELDPNRKAEQGGLIAKDTFGAFASTVAAGRTLRIASLVSLVTCLFVAVLGIALCSLIVLWNSHDAASPVHLLTFQILWALVLDFVTFILLRF